MRDDLYRDLKRRLEAEELVALATVVAGPGLGNQLLVRPGKAVAGTLGSEALDRWAVAEAAAHFATFASGRRSYEGGGEPVGVFLEVQPPRPKLVVVGAVHTAIALVEFANTLGFRTYVVDPRGAFATAERFGHATALSREWPQEALPRIGLNEATYVACLTHDLKIDVPALVAALASPARYIGVLGSRRTHAKRVKALEEAGVAAEDISRIRAPIGLDLGGRRPEEIAVAILAEIVAASHGMTAEGVGAVAR